MTFLNTSELTGAALDWAVSKAEGVDAAISRVRTNGTRSIVTHYSKYSNGLDGRDYSPSTDWAQAGPIIEREPISVYEDPHWNGGIVGTDRFLACQEIAIQPEVRFYGSSQTGSWTESKATFTGKHTMHGATYLVAAMRCFVASRFGDYVEVPEQLAA